MGKYKAQSAEGLPSFERPSEAVVFWALENLCQSGGGKCKVTFADLARRCSLAGSTVKRAVHRLADRKVIQFQPGCNQYQPSVYEISTDGGVDVSQSRSAGPKIGRPNPRDISCITNDLYIGDKHDGRAVHNQQGDGDPSADERLAFQVAEGLDDVKNLRLYESYCKRYPTEIILTAYVRAREVSPDKIKKSRGALFNFLVQKYGGKNKKNPSDSGSAPWSSGDGRGFSGSR